MGGWWLICGVAMSCLRSRLETQAPFVTVATSNAEGGNNQIPVKRISSRCVSYKVPMLQRQGKMIWNGEITANPAETVV